MSNNNNPPAPAIQPDIQTPHNREAEEALLSSLLIAPDLIPQAREIIAPDDIYTVRLQWIFEAMGKVSNNGTAANIVTIGDELERAGRLDKVGGWPYLTELSNFTPSTLDWESYAGIVKRDAHNRQLIKLAGEMARAAFDPHVNPADIVTQASDTLAAMMGATNGNYGELESLVELWPQYTLSEGLEKFKDDLDWLIYGLWQLDSVGLIYGDGASGKTYLSINMCTALACGLPVFSSMYPHLKPQKVLYFISEGRRHFFPRVLAAVNGLAFQYNRPVEEIRELVEQNLMIQTEVPQLYAQDAKRSIEGYLKLWDFYGNPPVNFTVIDTLHRASVGGDENSERDAGVILDNVGEYVRQTGSAVSIIHHSNKSGGYRGSSAYYSDADVMIKVEGKARAPRVVTIDKEKDAPPDGPISGTTFEMQFYIDNETEKSYVRMFEANSISDGGTEGRIEREINQLLANYPNGLSQNQICKSVKGRKVTIIKMLDKLRDDNKVSAVPKLNTIVYKPLI